MASQINFLYKLGTWLIEAGNKQEKMEKVKKRRKKAETSNEKSKLQCC